MISPDELKKAMDELEGAGPQLAPVDVMLSVALHLPLDEAREMVAGIDWARARVERLKNMQKMKICELLASAKIKYREAEFLMHMLFGEKDESNVELRNCFEAMTKSGDGGED
jgi:hypothetical protein